MYAQIGDNFRANGTLARYNAVRWAWKTVYGVADTFLVSPLGQTALGCIAGLGSGLGSMAYDALCSIRACGYNSYNITCEAISLVASTLAGCIGGWASTYLATVPWEEIAIAITSAVVGHSVGVGCNNMPN